MIKNKTVVLGVTGSIAAYKAADLASKLTQDGAKVITVMTESAQEFVKPLTFKRVTNQPTITGMFDRDNGAEDWHISLAEQADVVAIAPATANIIAKIASGICDDLLTCVICASSAPVLIAPAMNEQMYKNAITQGNIHKLKSLGYKFIGPQEGKLACGDKGVGCLAEVDMIIKETKKNL